MGALNEIDHTSNQLEDLQSYAGKTYTGARNYKIQQAVRSENIVTANESANLEFARKILVSLDYLSDEEAEQWYGICKLGYHEAIKNTHLHAK